MEAIGTFFVTLAIILTGNPLAIGAMVAACVYMGWSVSGGHYNPMLSFTAYLQSKLDRNLLSGYIIAQILGAFIALLGVYLVLRVPYLPPVEPELRSFIVALLIEGLLSFLFCYVFLIVINTAELRSSGLYGILIGGALMAVAFIRGLFNPAVALASLFLNAFMLPWPAVVAASVYVLGPVLGAYAASHAYNYFMRRDQGMTPR